MKRVDEVLDGLRSILTLCFGVSYIVNVFLRASWLFYLDIVLMLTVLMLSLFAAKGTSRVLGSILIVASVGLLAFASAPLEIWVKALQQNADLIVMFIFIPLIGIPVQHGGYSESLRSLSSRHANSEGRYYALVSGMAAVLGSLISIAAVPLTFEMSRESALSENKRVLGTALSRGFITCMIWAPTSATIALVASVTHIGWVDFFPCAIASALIAWTIGVIMVAVGARRSGASGDANIEGRQTDGRVDVSKLVELGIFAVLLIAFIAIVSQIFGLSVILVVAMASLIWPLVWMLCIRRVRAYNAAFKSEYFDKKLPNTKNQIVLFAGAGMLVQGIGYSGLGESIAQGLMLVTGQNIILLTVGIMAIVLITCVLGIHPIVAVAVIGGAIDPISCGMTSAYLALVLSMSWALGNAICPASANVIAVADLVQCSPFEVSIRWNGAYVGIAVVIFVAFASLMRVLGLL